MSETHPNAMKAEAAELRRQASLLLARADTLDPPIIEEVQKPTRKFPEGAYGRKFRAQLDYIPHEGEFDGI